MMPGCEVVETMYCSARCLTCRACRAHAVPMPCPCRAHAAPAVQGEAGYHSQWDSKLLNYSNYETLRYLLSNLRYWIQEMR